MFLTAEELRTLTECGQKSTQRAWLKAHGYRFEVGKKGHPRVARGHVERKLGVGVAPTPEPDFSFFGKRA